MNMKRVSLALSSSGIGVFTVQAVLHPSVLLKLAIAVFFIIAGLSLYGLTNDET